jgi:hypothetical protein
MSAAPPLPLALWLAAIVGVGLAAAGWRDGAIASAPLPAIGHLADLAPIQGETLARATEHLAETDPFRLDRRPAVVAYQVSLAGGDAAQVVTRPPRPVLVLKGIIGGRTGAGRSVAWLALLDGVPGHAATAVVRDGDTLGGLRVRHIGRDTVVVTAADTTWQLTVRRAWQ